MHDRAAGLERWHQVVRSQDADRIEELLADEVVFRSPAVHTPVRGVPEVSAYLRAAMAVLGPTIEYQREWRHDATSAVLEFTALIGDDVKVHGVDMLTWDDQGQLTECVVMVRPFKAINTLIGLMAAELKAQQRSG